MRRTSTKRTLRFLIGMAAVAAMVMAVGIPSLQAEKRTTRVGPETQRGGLTFEDIADRHRQLHAELSAVMPAGVGRTPLEVNLNEQDRLDLAAPAPNGTAPMTIGVVKAVAEAAGKPFGKAFNHGVVQKNPDGSFVWAMTVSSPGARSIRVHFTDFALPADTEMFFMSPGGQVHGPYIAEGRTGSGDFWTRSILSPTGTLLLRYTGIAPDRDLPKMSFVIADVGHIQGRPPVFTPDDHDTWPCADNSPCLVDVNCVNTGPAAPAEDAVAKMEWIAGQYIYTCTGGLLADTDPGTQIPYFLTANHCFSSSIANLETFFNYTTDSCNGICPNSIVFGGTPPPASTIGITVEATGSKGDFTLATLDQAPPAGATYLGWNNAEIAYTAGVGLYRVSNANFGPQVYSDYVVDATTGTCTQWPRGERIYSKNLTGSTMGGSSGSPVVNSAGEVVGQLSGCCGYNCADDCDFDNNWTVDGALAYYWDSVSGFLDPQPECTTDPECDDGLYCTGVETCVAGSCQSSGDPCSAGETCNEATDTCDTPVCDGDGACEAGENCNNCPNDCRAKTTGAPNGRYCCNGDLPDCGDQRCSEEGWSCGGGSTCTINEDCDDGQFCNGVEICSGGSCQSGTDPCPGQGCDEGADQCVTCLAHKDPCATDSDCCSNYCKRGRCQGN